MNRNSGSRLPPSLAPRGLSRVQAAEYIGVGATKFDEMVGDGRMPRPKRIDGRTVWDRIKLDEAFDFSDPDLWRSNSFASLRPRLVVWMHSVVLDLQCDPISPMPLMSTRNDFCKRVAQQVMDRLQPAGIDVVSR